MSITEIIGLGWLIFTVGMGTFLVLLTSILGTIALWTAANRGFKALEDEIRYSDGHLSIRALLQREKKSEVSR